MSAAITSFLKAFEKEKSFEKVENGHSDEIDALVQMYAYLISPEEFSEVADIAGQKSNEGEVAKRIMRYRRDAAPNRQF